MILHFLSTKRSPVDYRALNEEIRCSEKWRPNSQYLPAGAIRAALSITQAAGLVRLTRHGFSITGVGREVQRRIQRTVLTERSVPAAFSTPKTLS